MRVSLLNVARRWLMAVSPAVGVLGFLLLWQLLVRVFDIAELPAPWDVLRHLGSDPGYYWTNGRRTAWNASLGFPSRCSLVSSAAQSWHIPASSRRPCSLSLCSCR